MLKKDIKSIFKAIRRKDIQLVKSLVSERPNLVNVCSIAPPKKDDGQSPLQVAFKTGNFIIANFFIDNGADINFMEKSEINEWRAPVIHDCIRATIFNSYTLQKDTSQFDIAFSLLRKMIEKGADVTKIDSYGNNCLLRALLDSRQMVDHPNVDFSDDILLKQLKSIFSILIENGADPEKSTNTRKNAYEIAFAIGLKKYDLL